MLPIYFKGTYEIESWSAEKGNNENLQYWETNMFKQFLKNEKLYEKMGNYRSCATIKHKDFEIRINIVKM